MNIEELFEIPQKENISLAELSEKGIMSKKTAYKNIVEGKLTAIKIGQRWYIPRKALLSFLEDAHKAGIESIKSIKWIENENNRYISKKNKKK